MAQRKNKSSRSPRIPKIRGFHAHVYYDKKTRDAAARIRRALGKKFSVQLGRWHDEEVGPHTQSMYQVVFSAEQFGEVVPWLMLNRKGLNILVHPQTDNGLKDHLDRSLWLGRKLRLKTNVLGEG